MGRRPDALLDVAVVGDDRSFAILKQEWDDLYRSSPCATPFQSWAWLYSWWEYYGKDYELRLITMRDETGLLIGLIPLMLERRGSFRRLLFVGSGITDHLDLLAREGWESAVVEAGVQTLRRMDSWRVVDLQELRPTAAAWGISRDWTGPQAHVQQSNCAEIRTRPWEELLASLSRSRREKSRKTVRRVKEDAVHCELASQDRVRQAARRWLDLHKEYWRGREINPEHLTKRFGSHTLAAAERISATGLGGIYEFRRGEDVIASDFVLAGREYVASYLHGADRYALRRFQVSSLFMWNWIGVALERGVPMVSMLRGADRYKLRWNPEIIPNRRLLLGRNRTSFAPYATYHILRSRAAEYAKSENAPAWLRSTAYRLKRFLP